MLFADGHPRNRALYTADIALHDTRKAHPDLDAVTDAAHRALAHLTDVRSERLQRSPQTVTRTLQPHARSRTVSAYLDSYHAATAAA
ncbi:hypothetical protein AB0A05_38560 [Streptomyces sp. NPDC046374]|uniref:hypothetical protein n=1 Tax=Streptomyces sp. NPDC046374 TaxID=3154917 RepID=UPI0033F163F6